MRGHHLDVEPGRSALAQAIDQEQQGELRRVRFAEKHALTGEQAADWGLIWKAVDDEGLDAEVDAIAAKLASLPPLGLAAIKAIIRSTGERTLDEELDLQRDEMRRLGFTEDYREGVAAFLEKRSARFTGR